MCVRTCVCVCARECVRWRGGCLNSSKVLPFLGPHQGVPSTTQLPPAHHRQCTPGDHTVVCPTSDRFATRASQALQQQLFYLHSDQQLGGAGVRFSGGGGANCDATQDHSIVRPEGGCPRHRSSCRRAVVSPSSKFKGRVSAGCLCTDSSGQWSPGECAGTFCTYILSSGTLVLLLYVCTVVAPDPDSGRWH